MDKQVTGRLNIWADSYSGVGPEQLRNPPADLAQKVQLYRTEWDMSKDGYTKIGEAEVVLHLYDTQSVVANQVESLKAQIDKERADSEAKVTALNRRINDLLALPLESV